MLDVHVLVSKDTPKDWSKSCLSSLRLAARRAPFAVSIHEIAGVPGHIGKGRAKGYAMGFYPWVTCVDDDDLVLPDAFLNLASHLETEKSAISVQEVEIRQGVFRQGGKRHHLNLYRREVLIEHSEWPCCGDVAQIARISESEWLDTEINGYVWRVYTTSKARLMRLADPAELRKAHG